MCRGHMSSGYGRVGCVILLALAGVASLAAAAASAQQKPTGAELIATKCFQCHTQAMWQDQRQDTRAWEANLYRMVGRGALWTTEEIKLMAEYLGTNFGPAR
jgi:mono/diheme cytochrome c family protein